MNISTLIARLQAVQAEYGDIATDYPDCDTLRVEDRFRCPVDWPAGSSVLLADNPHNGAKPEPVVILT